MRTRLSNNYVVIGIVVALILIGVVYSLSSTKSYQKVIPIPNEGSHSQEVQQIADMGNLDTADMDIIDAHPPNAAQGAMEDQGDSFMLYK